MGRRIRIPGLLDLLLVDGPEEIRALAQAPALRRGAPVFGPPLNRLIQLNLLDTLQAGGVALPSARPLDDTARQRESQTLAERLNPAASHGDAETLDAIAGTLRGDHRQRGPLCQQLIGRLFVPNYVASRASWRAARDLDRAARSPNPLRRGLWAVTGRLNAAQTTLAEKVGGDPAAVHATGIAVHSFVRAVEMLDSVLADRVLRRSLSRRAALGRAMVAPPAVLRVGTGYTQTPAGEVSPGTVVIMQLGTAAAKAPDQRIAFLAESPSACPASALVPRLLSEIWTRATGEATPLPTAAE